MKKPGELSDKAKVARMLRVDLAGEYAAIYEGQLKVLKGHKEIAHMAEQEEKHLATFQKLVVERGVRPTALHPLWHLAGLTLGAGTALLGEKAAMACTVAVEDEISDHYAEQIKALPQSEKKLAATLKKFRAEELEHRDTGLKHGAEQTPAYTLLYKTIRRACKTAIKVAERV
jgi:3-demethoxyubiquinol 3-hydroxylase